MLRLLYRIWNNTLNSVPFGICTMALIGLYIAIGSGKASVREYFEMDELQFFAAWPLVTLMILLVLNLATVTLVRIPFTPPRYGVWCVHAGIITLIFGMFAYYSRKVEGQILVPVKQTVDHFYDRWERALYVRAGNRGALPLRLEKLPRFSSYPAASDSSVRLDRRGLRDLKPIFMIENRDGGPPRARSLGEELGLDHEPRIDVIGYHPYATIQTTFEQPDGDARGDVGIRVTITDPASNRSEQEWLVSGQGDRARSSAFDTTFEHRHLATADEVRAVVESAGKLHRLDILVGNTALSMYVEPGKTYPVGESGYEITVENYLPNWRTMQGELVDLLTFMVKTPTQEFRRQVIPGRPNPTDWKLDEPDAGPMGKRQDKPLDPDFRTLYTFTDRFELLGKAGSVKQTLLTNAEGKSVTRIIVGRDRAAEVVDHPEGVGEFTIPQMPQRGPFQPKLTKEEIDALPTLRVRFERSDNVRRVDRVIDIPRAQRDRLEGEAGVNQVVTVRITSGGRERVVHVPFTQWTAEAFMPWKGDDIWLEGANKPLRLQLGNALVGIPASVTVERFELVPYEGGTKQSGLMRDFRATLRVVDSSSGMELVGVAQMNSPVYFKHHQSFPLPDDSWILFQSGWNQQAGETLTILGVGNRPGVRTMTIGSIMIGVGLLYAFYVKPIIIARNKRRALESAGGKWPVAIEPGVRRKPVEV